ncbi:MAG: hypothetical protein LBU55_01745 [Elusimicrobiota bacterium]|jgi:TolB protein|nr:hypothetical protein [Elusimicrobiota bacterium]
MKKLVLFCASILVLFFCCSTIIAQESIYLSLTSSAKRFDIGIEDFVSENKSKEEIEFAKLLQAVIENDLLLSRYFNIVIEDRIKDDDVKNEMLDYWKTTGVGTILSASVSKFDNDVVLDIKLLDANAGDVIWKRIYKSNVSNYRYMAHSASDEITRVSAGEFGIARSKIAFSNNTTKHKEIYIVDYDGYNLRKVTNDNSINILPKWSPDGERIAYTSYVYNNPDLFEINIVQKKRYALSRHRGLNVASAYSPDGSTLAITLSKGSGYPGLYLINNNGEILRQLAVGYFISTSPSFSPNGQEIVFVSDRRGIPQVYIMNVYGGNIRALGTDGFCDSPSWSPRGDKIVFTMRQHNAKNFDLYIYDLHTAKTTKLTKNKGNNENPSWSPDGRFIVFSSDRSGKEEIYIIAIDGSGSRKLVEISGRSYTPSWSTSNTKQ